MRTDDEIQLILSGHKGPREVPLWRLAEYMREFAKLLGEADDVYFSGISKGSVCIAAHSKRGNGLGAAARRAVNVSRGEGNQDSRKSYETIGAMAAKDGRSARLTRRNSVLLHFPTGRLIQPKPLSIRDWGHVVGYVSAIYEDKAEGVKVRIRPLDGGALIYGTAPGHIGDKLAQYFKKTIRIEGVGWWERDQQGAWSVREIEVEGFQPVETVGIRQAVDRLRALPVEWEDDPLDEIWQDIESA